MLDRGQIEGTQLGELGPDLGRAALRGGCGRIGQPAVAPVIAEVGRLDRIAIERPLQYCVGEFGEPARGVAAQRFSTFVM
ncbi:MAG: hypothetical protein QOC66_874 [Pseudonocardiales bacterium]|jgi:hypothetical protein|nr:hypothetical protein [Pseudonocardiales bacterium]